MFNKDNGSSHSITLFVTDILKKTDGNYFLTEYTVV